MSTEAENGTRVFKGMRLRELAAYELYLSFIGACAFVYICAGVCVCVCVYP